MHPECVGETPGFSHRNVNAFRKQKQAVAKKLLHQNQCWYCLKFPTELPNVKNLSGLEKAVVIPASTDMVETVLTGESWQRTPENSICSKHCGKENIGYVRSPFFIIVLY